METLFFMITARAESPAETTRDESTEEAQIKNTSKTRHDISADSVKSKNVMWNVQRGSESVKVWKESVKMKKLSLQFAYDSNTDDSF